MKFILRVESVRWRFKREMRRGLKCFQFARKIGVHSLGINGESEIFVKTNIRGANLRDSDFWFGSGTSSCIPILLSETLSLAN